MNLTKDQVNIILQNGKAKGLKGQDILDGLIESGHSLEGVDTTQAKQEIAARKTPEVSMTEKPSFLDRVGGRIKKSGEEIVNIHSEDDSSALNKGVRETATAFSTVPAVAFEALPEPARKALSWIGKQAAKGFEIGIENIAETPLFEDLGRLEAEGFITRENAPDYFKVKDTLGIAAGAGEISGNILLADQATKVLQAGSNITKKGIDVGTTEAKEGLANLEAKSRQAITTAQEKLGKTGVGQTVEDLAERIPRAIERVKDSAASSALRAEKIRTASPSIKKAYKVNLDDAIIETVDKADDATKQALKEVVDIAESPKTIGVKKQPSIVSGNLAAKQYDLITSQKDIIGKQIGDLTKSLSKTTKLNLDDSFNQIDDILTNQGITPVATKTGTKLDFSGSSYTPAQRAKIQQLYDLATEGGTNLSPAAIKGKDKLFSTLKRESNFEGVGDLIIETPTGQKSMFQVFRDIYSKKLDTISPEVRTLNSKYRELSSIVDDIEDSIFKTPNFNATKAANPAEFAKVNMRRIFGESQSSPAFEAVADMMDKYSRGLGYKGATPKQVAAFAEYIRKLYPETIPETGFQGGIKMGLGDLAETAMKAGAPNLLDQRKALMELLKSTSVKSGKAATSIETATAQIKQSGAFPIEKSIANGDIPRASVFKGKGNTLNPAFAEGRISDVAQKLDMHKAGLGDIYRATVNVDNVTMKEIVEKGLEVLKSLSK